MKWILMILSLLITSSISAVELKLKGSEHFKDVIKDAIKMIHNYGYGDSFWSNIDYFKTITITPTNTTDYAGYWSSDRKEIHISTCYGGSFTVFVTAQMLLHETRHAWYYAQSKINNENMLPEDTEERRVRYYVDQFYLKYTEVNNGYSYPVETYKIEYYGGAGESSEASE